jgi:hypothetical protein
MKGAIRGGCPDAKIVDDVRQVRLTPKEIGVPQAHGSPH